MKIRLIKNHPRYGAKGLVCNLHSELAERLVRAGRAEYTDPKMARAWAKARAQAHRGRLVRVEHKAIHPAPEPEGEAPEPEGEAPEPEGEAPEPEGEAPEAPSLDWKKSELVALCEQMGLDTKGTKPALLERINAARA